MAEGLLGLNPADPNDNYVYVAYEGLSVMNMIEVFTPESVASWCRDNLPQAVKDTGYPRVLKDGSSAGNPIMSYAVSPMGATSLTGKYVYYSSMDLYPELFYTICC